MGRSPLLSPRTAPVTVNTGSPLSGGQNGLSQLFNNLMQNNPAFRSFVDQNRGKTIEQIAQENGINMNLLNMLIRR